MSEESDVANWFWEIIDTTRPNLTALAQRLEQLSREQLLMYYDEYSEASMKVCEPWDGDIGEGIELSEDSTEDFTDWVVSNGKAFWLGATGPGRNLIELYRLFEKLENGKAVASSPWAVNDFAGKYAGYLSPKEIAIKIFQDRYDEDFYQAIDDFIDEL